jgi:hypothetical protein
LTQATGSTVRWLTDGIMQGVSPASGGSGETWDGKLDRLNRSCRIPELFVAQLDGAAGTDFNQEMQQ